MNHVGLTASRVVIPLLGVGVLLLFREYRLWAVVIAVLEAGLAVVGGSARTPSHIRAWALPVALFLAGGVALVLPGALQVSAVLLLAAVAVLAMATSQRAALLALALVTVLQLGNGISILLRPRAARDYEPIPSVVAQFATTAATLTAGWVVVSMWGRLEAQRKATLSRARGEIQDGQARFDELEARAGSVIAGQRALRQRIEYLEASLRATRELTVQQGLGPLLEGAATHTARSFGFLRAQVYLLDSTGEWVTLMSSSHSSDNDAVRRGYRVRVDGDELVANVVRARQPKVGRGEQGAQVGEGPDSSDGNAVPEPGVSLALPLLLPESGQALGVLLVQTAAAVDFGKEDLDVLGSYTGHLARLIDHARGVRDDAAASEAGGPLLGTANLLVTARTDADVFDVIIDVVRDTSPDRVLIVQVPDGGEVPQIVLDYRDQQAQRVEVDLVDFGPPGLVDLALCGLSLESPLWAEDLNNLDPLLSPELAHALRDLAQATGSAGLALIPLRAASARAEGEIIVLYPKAQRFATSERRLHQIFVDFGGAALERTRLLAEAQDRLDLGQQRAVIEARLGRAPDVPTILRVAVRDMARALRAIDGEICLYPGGPEPAADAVGGRPVPTDSGPGTEG